MRLPASIAYLIHLCPLLAVESNHTTIQISQHVPQCSHRLGGATVTFAEILFVYIITYTGATLSTLAATPKFQT